MGSGEQITRFSVSDGVKSFPALPEILMAEFNTAIANYEYAHATALLNALPSAQSNSKSSVVYLMPLYDARMADKAYKAGCAALAAGKLKEVLHFLNISLSNCPPDKTPAVTKLQSLISLTSQQLKKSRN